MLWLSHHHNTRHIYVTSVVKTPVSCLYAHVEPSQTMGSVAPVAAVEIWCRQWAQCCLDTLTCVCKEFWDGFINFLMACINCPAHLKIFIIVRLIFKQDKEYTFRITFILVQESMRYSSFCVCPIVK